MGISRWSGPGVFGLPQGSGDSNPTPGPTMSNHGFAVLDDRYTQSGGDVTAIYPCMFGAANDICVVDQAPATLSAVNLVAAAVPTTAVAMTLAAASTGTATCQMLAKENVDMKSLANTYVPILTSIAA